MGFWDKIFKKKEQGFGVYNLNDVLSGITPVFSDGFGNNIYASDVVQQAVYAIVSEMKKLDMVHTRQKGNDVTSVDGNIQNVLNNPNPLMTSSDYIEKITWNLLLNYNAFIYPLWQGNKLIGLYPLQPSKVEFQMNSATGEYAVAFQFPNGYEGVIPYANIIHLRYHYGINDYMGGDMYGNPDYKAILETLKLNDSLTKGLAKSLNIQTAVNGVVKIKTMMNNEDQMQKIKEFEKKLQDNTSGLLPIDIASEYMPLNKQVQLLDNTVLEFLDRKILRNWGVSIPIINGDYTKEQYEAFYQKSIEPLVKMFTEAHTKGIFSNKASFSFGNKISFYPKDLIFMNTTQKLEMIRLLGDSGGMYENEKRTAFGLKPLPELAGVRMMSLNYVNVNDASRYQTGKDSSEGNKEDDTGNQNDGTEGVTDNE